MTQGVLILNLRASLQSWGAGDGKLGFRTTRKFPTKSGTLGCVSAALGIERGDSEGLRWLNTFGFAVAELKGGSLVRDYHIVQNVLKADGKIKDVEISERFYLAGAHFLAFLEGHVVDLNRIAEGLRRPKWPVYLGRKSCPPSAPLLTKEPLVMGSLKDILRPGDTPIWIETDSEVPGAMTDFDRPLDFKFRSFGRRNYVSRHVNLEGLRHAIFDEA